MPAIRDRNFIPTLADVAQAAGVSTATVSRALNDKEKVSAQTLKRVTQAIDALGYTPNFNARAMAARRSQTIGAIIPTMENAIFARGVQAFQERLQDLGYTLLVSSSAYQPDLEADQIRTLLARGVDGLLLIGHARDASTYAYLARRHVPFVQAWSLDPDRTHASVGFDNRAAMRGLTDHVLSLGHRQIAFISGVVAGNDRAQARLDGVRDSLTGHGLPPDQLRVVETAYGLDQGAAALASLMAEGPRPSAVICGNDVLALGALSQARLLGLDVPGDLSITGFDDIALAEHAYPPLTTVHVPHWDMGRQAADLLTAMIAGDTDARTVALPTELVMRASLAAV